jgi:hypothetical protein
MTAPAVLPIPPNGHRSHDSPRDEDAWTQLEQRYQQGTAALNVVKEPVDRPHDVEQRDAKARREEAASPGTAAYARMFYEKKGYLPSLLSRELPVIRDGGSILEDHADQHSRATAREEERRRVLRRFELHSAQPQGRYPAIDEIAQLAKDVFEVDAVIVNAGESASSSRCRMHVDGLKPQSSKIERSSSRPRAGRRMRTLKSRFPSIFRSVRMRWASRLRRVASKFRTPIRNGASSGILSCWPRGLSSSSRPPVSQRH